MIDEKLVQMICESLHLIYLQRHAVLLLMHLRHQQIFWDSQSASQPVVETGTGAGAGTGTFRMIHQGDKNHMQKGKKEKAKAKAVRAMDN